MPKALTLLVHHGKGFHPQSTTGWGESGRGTERTPPRSKQHRQTLSSKAFSLTSNNPLAKVAYTSVASMGHRQSRTPPSLPPASAGATQAQVQSRLETSARTKRGQQ